MLYEKFISQKYSAKNWNDKYFLLQGDNTFQHISLKKIENSIKLSESFSLNFDWFIDKNEVINSNEIHRIINESKKIKNSTVFYFLDNYCNFIHFDKKTSKYTYIDRIATTIKSEFIIKKNILKNLPKNYNFNFYQYLDMEYYLFKCEEEKYAFLFAGIMKSHIDNLEIKH